MDSGMRELNHDRDRVIKVVTTGRTLATNIDVYF